MTNAHCVFRGDTEYVVFNPEGGGEGTAIYGLYRYVPLVFKQFTQG